MDSLRPDRDDLDLYNSRKNKNNSAKSSRGRLKEKSKNKAQVRELDSHPTSATGRQAKTPNNLGSAHSVAVTQTSNSPFVVFLLVLTVLACGGLSYLYWQQSQTVESLNQRLLSADEFIKQSKLEFARIRGDVDETGEELLQTGSSAEKKMAWLESEVRKLWGVSYDRNRKSIKEHEEELGSLKGLVAENKKGLAGQKTALSTLKSESSKASSMLDGRISSLAGELSITRAEQEEFLASLNQQITGFEARYTSIENRIQSVQDKVEKSSQARKEDQESLLSIDESRRQLINRVVDLESKLDKLSAATKSPSQ